MKHSLSLWQLIRRYVTRFTAPLILTASVPAFASDAGADASINFITGNLWLLIATAMVFLMHLGFATLEAGLTQEKNSVNILFKNVCIIAIGILSYAMIGFNLMYPGDSWILGKVLGAVEIQKKRYRRHGDYRRNADLPLYAMDSYCPIEDDARHLLVRAQRSLRFSARSRRARTSRIASSGTPTRGTYSARTPRPCR